MKTTKPLFALILMCICFTASAQYVTIPQSFSTYIHRYIDSSATVGSDLDTTNTSVLTLADLSIDTSALVDDISGLQYFKGLKNFTYINTAHIGIDSLPELPPLLEYVEVRSLSNSANTVTHVKDFPSTLLTIKLPYSCIDSLPAFPPRLQKLYLDYSCIDTLPDLPNTVDSLFLDGCTALVQLPAVLPDSLRYFTARQCNFANIPPLPINLNLLDVSFDTSITQLGPLNANLQTLEASGTRLVTVNGAFPSTLYYLNLANTFITSLPLLPDTMYYLNLGFTPISSLANVPQYTHCLILESMSGLAQLPNNPINATSLVISNNPNWPIDNIVASTRYDEGLYSYRDTAGSYPYMYLRRPYYPMISASVTASYNNLQQVPALTIPVDGSIVLSHNQITSVDSFWLSNIYSLDLSYNLIDSFHAPSQGSSLFNLNLSANRLTSINSLPPSFGNQARKGTLNISDNQITDINTPLTFSYVYLTNNQVKCLPFLLPGMRYLFIAGNPITCLPNTYDSLVIDNPLPLCQQGNANNCPGGGTVKGIVFTDINANGLIDTGDIPLIDTLLTLSVNGDLYYTRSDSTGYYEFAVPLSLPYIVSAQFRSGTITTPAISSVMLLSWQVDSNQNIGVQFAPPAYDLAITIEDFTEPRPGFHYRYHIDCQNLGGQLQDGSITLVYDSILFFQSSSLQGSLLSNTITWQINSLPSNDHLNIDVDFIVPPTTPLGSIINATVSAISNYPDTNYQDNYADISAIAIGSYDPNEKVAKPAALTQSQIDSKIFLTYTVRFQNTGTASAINISIQDTLSPLVDLNTLKIITSSHEYNWQLNGRVLIVDYTNINLPDSNTNEILSHGFFTYKIKLDSSFDNSLTIDNTAYIYFDFNAPIATNTTHTGKMIVGIQNLGTDDAVRLFPNPASNLLNITWGGEAGTGLLHMDVVNVLGQAIDHFTLTERATHQLSVNDYASGLYLLRYYNDEHRQTKSLRFIVGH